MKKTLGLCAILSILRHKSTSAKAREKHMALTECIPVVEKRHCEAVFLARSNRRAEKWDLFTHDYLTKQSSRDIL